MKNMEKERKGFAVEKEAESGFIYKAPNRKWQQRSLQFIQHTHKHIDPLRKSNPI